jgi:GNAT superfamily N-acetyltransferase
MPAESATFEFHPVTPDRWHDLEKLFGERGACGGCWCMWWRLKRSEFDQKKGAETKRALKRLIARGQVPGLLAYAEGEPVGWCSVAPRKDFSALERSRLLQRVDEEPVWSVVCFFVSKPYRRKGVTHQLLTAAIEYAREHGAKIVEGYPVEPKAGSAPDVFVFTGLASTFLKVGFVEVARRSETRPIMRFTVRC